MVFEPDSKQPPGLPATKQVCSLIHQWRAMWAATRRAIGETKITEIILSTATKPVKAFTVQRAIRDARDLTSTERLVLLIITTFYPNPCPARATLARGCGMHPESLRRTLKALEVKGWLQRSAKAGRPNTYTITPLSKVAPYSELPPTQSCPPPPNSRLENPPTQDCPKETKKRQEQESKQVAHIASKEAKAERLAGWQGVWNEVVGVGALPTLAQLRRVRLDVTEDMLSHCLGETALAVGTKDIGNARGLFFSELRKAKGDEAPWTKEQVKRALYPASLTRGRDMRRPSSQPAPKPPPPETEEEKQARRARTAAVLASLDRSILFGGDA